MKASLRGTFLSVAIIISLTNSIAQNLKFGYDHWPNKYAISKDSIEFPPDMHKKYNMYFLKVSSQKSLDIRFNYFSLDSSKYFGEISINIYDNSQQAQLNMNYFLCDFSAHIERYTDEITELFDVAFASEVNGILLLVFTKNNVFAWIQAPTQFTKEIAIHLINNITKAPKWNGSIGSPSLVSFPNTKLE
jgi:hypothetical protein